MQRQSIVILAGIALLATLFLREWTGISDATLSRPARAISTCGIWNQVSSPNVGTSTNYLNAVAAISSTNIWTVGTEGNGNGGFTLVEHWNGKQWKVVASPNVNGSLSSTLSGVAAITANNVWAVGNYFDALHAQQTLIEHWNGKSWSVVPSPGGGWLSGVAAIAANNIWAVGSVSGNNNNGYLAQIEHWNGKSWSIVSSPGSGQLFGVTAVAANNVWAVGNGASTHGIETLVEHWKGSAWSVVGSSGLGLATNTLNAVTAISDNNAWAVGDESNSTGPSAPFAPLVEHWNGSTWSVVTSHLQGTSDFLNGIAATSANNIWAVGDYRSGIDPQGPYFTLIEHWNGSTWSVVNSPSPGSAESDLTAVAHLPATNSLWTVGSIQDSASQTLTEFYC